MVFYLNTHCVLLCKQINLGCKTIILCCMYVEVITFLGTAQNLL